MDWPIRFPEDCPPDDAQPARGVVYHLTHNPLRARDFWTKREEHPDKRYSDSVQECKANGLSILLDIEDAKGLRRTVPYFRNELNTIAVGQLSPELGMTKPAPSRLSPSHCTWWVPTGVDRAAHFRILEE